MDLHSSWIQINIVFKLISTFNLYPPFSAIKNLACVIWFYIPPSSLSHSSLNHPLFSSSSLPLPILIPHSCLSHLSLIPHHPFLIPPSFLPHPSLIHPSSTPHPCLLPSSYLPHPSLFVSSCLPHASLISTSSFPHPSMSFTSPSFFLIRLLTLSLMYHNYPYSRHRINLFNASYPSLISPSFVPFASLLLLKLVPHLSLKPP